MTKQEIVKEILKQMCDTRGRHVNQTDVKVMFECLCDVVAAELLGGGDVLFPGVGKLLVSQMAEREGRNLKTGEKVTSPARRKVKFRASKSFAYALN